MSGKLKHAALGVVAGTLTCSAAFFFSAGAPNVDRQEPAGVEYLDRHFAGKYEGMATDDMLGILEQKSRDRDLLQDLAIESLSAMGDYEVLSTDPASGDFHWILGGPERNSAWAVRPLDAESGLYQKVLIPRGFDAELDLLIDECAWLENRIGHQPNGAVAAR